MSADALPMVVPRRSAEGTPQSLQRFGVAWRSPSEPLIFPVGMLEYDGAVYRFHYLASAGRIPGFRPVLGFSDFDQKYTAETLFPFFEQRVVDAKRPDFHKILTALDLPDDATPLDVLDRTGGRRIGDRFQVVREPLVDHTGQTACTFLVHGTRFLAAENDEVEPAISRLSTGDRLQLVPEPRNPANPRALLVVTHDDISIGWVPDLLIDYADVLSQSGPIALHVRRANGAEVPFHLRVVAELTGQASAGYRPFDAPPWQPDANDGRHKPETRSGTATR